MADRYTLERELGRGGMANVYLAHDLKHDRPVALKVMHPELAATLGPERFLREIRVTAQLDHPHILTVLDSGEAAGELWYTMPYVHGESLRDRLRREIQLPVDTSVRIVSEVADALDYAHRQGVVHRDIKPENILLAEGHARVADFGLARALEVAGAGQLTETGLVVGTPAYMAPEQASGDRVDGRSDIYALGCVLYEALAGEPPFTGRTAQAVMAKRLASLPSSVRITRPDVPAPLEAVLMKALAQVPAARFTSAGELLHALEQAAAIASVPATAPEASRRAMGVRWGGGVALALAATLGLALALPVLRNRAPPPTVDPRVVAVVPFRVAGADSSLHYLREGMVDLLALRLSGTGGLRAVDPRTMLSAWRRVGGSPADDIARARAVGLARDLGAGSLLEGEVIGADPRLTLNATLTDATGHVTAQASVEGSSDSLASLVDRLAVQLLAHAAGEAEDHLASLTTTSLPALRAYLDGMRAYRRGDYATARALFQRALANDSAFALAALFRTRAGMWLNDAGGRDFAWQYRSKLPRRDRLLLFLTSGPPGTANAREDIDSAEALVGLAPDDPEAWSELGDRLFHYGALTGLPDAPQRALRAYERAAKLDSTYAPAFEHFYELHFALGDTAASHAALNRLLRGKPRDAAPVARWFARIWLGDTALGTRSLSDDSLRASPIDASRMALRHARGLAEAESLLGYLIATVASDATRRSLQSLWWTFNVSRGKPRQALAGMPDSPDRELRAGMILDAIYADADMEHAARLAERVPRRYPRPTAGTSWERVVEGYAGAQYDLVRGEPAAAQRLVRAWREVRPAGDTTEVLRLASHLSLLLDAQLGALHHRSDALARLEELDSVLLTGPTYGGWLTNAGTFGGFEPVANLIAARLWHERGETARALATIRRRVVGLDSRAAYVSQIRDEARYAALVGDRDGAIRAYRHYLALRADAEPAVRPKVDEVWAELHALQSEATDR